MSLNLQNLLSSSKIIFTILVHHCFLLCSLFTCGFIPFKFLVTLVGFSRILGSSAGGDRKSVEASVLGLPGGFICVLLLICYPMGPRHIFGFSHNPLLQANP